MALINCPECGKEVSDASKTCIHCGYRLRKSLIKLIDEKKKIVIGICIGIIICIIIGFIVDASVIASRSTYKTESDMKSALQGIWVYKSDISNSAMWAIEIEDDKLIQHFYSDDEGFLSDINFNPSRGTISTSTETFIIKKNNNYFKGYGIYLLEGEKEYYSGSLSSLERDPDSSDYKDDMNKAKAEVYAYFRLLKTNKQTNITSISIINGEGICSGNYYYFDCSVKYTNDDTRIGIVEVYKNSSGEFEAQGFDFKYN